MSQANAQNRGRGWRSLMLAAVAFGLAGGVLEVAVLAARLRWLNEGLLLSRQFVWMVPAVSVGYCVGLGVLLSCARAMFTIPSRRAGIALLAFLAFLGPLLALPQYFDAVPRLQLVLTVVLAAGLATLSARFIAPRIENGLRRLPRLIIALAALIACLAFSVNARRTFEERDMLAHLPPAAADAPNVLLIVLDTVRVQSLSLYGHSRETTPELERMAPASVVFNVALSASPWTLPSHATMFTGRWPHELSVYWGEPLDGTHATLAETLRAHGYATAAFVANLIYGSSFHGLDRGFIHYEDYPLSLGQAILSSSIGIRIATNAPLRYWLNDHRVLNRKTAREINDDFLAWLSRRPPRPFFAFLNYMDAHEPYLPPVPFDGRFGSTRERTRFKHSGVDAFRLDKSAMSQEENGLEVAAYEGAIAYLDHQLGELIKELQGRSLLDNTLVIITSDHGEQLGEHRLFGHGNSLYRQLLQVPLLIRCRNRAPAGTIVREPVSLRDVPATVMELIGLGDRAVFPGSSLTRYWMQAPQPPGSSDESQLSDAGRRRPPKNPGEPLGNGEMHSLVGSGYHYIENVDGRAELYDLVNDPGEERDLSGSDEAARIIERFRSSLATVLTASPRFDAGGVADNRKGQEIDTRTDDQMRRLGY